MTITASMLDTAVGAVCPIDGVAGPIPPQSPWTLYSASDGSQWRIDFKDAATNAQRQAAIEVLAGYSDPPTVPNVTGRQINSQMIASGCSLCVISWLSKVGTTDGNGKATGAKPDDWNYWKSIALDTIVPTENPKVARILIGGGVINPDGSSAVAAFMAAAQKLPP